MYSLISCSRFGEFRLGIKNIRAVTASNEAWKTRLTANSFWFSETHFFKLRDKLAKNAAKKRARSIAERNSEESEA